MFDPRHHDNDHDLDEEAITEADNQYNARKGQSYLNSPTNRFDADATMANFYEQQQQQQQHDEENPIRFQVEHQKHPNLFKWRSHIKSLIVALVVLVLMAILLICSFVLLNNQSKCTVFEEGMKEFSAIHASDLMSAIIKSRGIDSTESAHIQSLHDHILPKLYQMTLVVNDLYLSQMWKYNHKLLQHVSQSSSLKSKCKGSIVEFFELNMGPWNSLDNNSYMLVDHVPSLHQFTGDELVKGNDRPLGANYYPLDMDRTEFEQYVQRLVSENRSEELEMVTGFYHVIRRNESNDGGNDGQQLIPVPYSVAFEEHISQLKQLTEELIALLPEEEYSALIQFLKLRAQAFTDNKYDTSDVAWMQVNDENSLLEVTLGPYETYDDVMFGYKAAFEMFVGIRNVAESTKLQQIVKLLPSLSTSLPIDAAYVHLLSPGDSTTARVVRVVDQVMNGGDARKGVQTAAYNLPNDAHVVEKHGSKRVLLRNIQEAKFSKTLVPLKSEVLGALQRPYVTFDGFFLHIMAHELMHGMGPKFIYSENSTDTPVSVRAALQEHYSVIEETKADIGGLWLLCQILNNDLMQLNITMSKEATELQAKLGISHNDMVKRSILVTYMTSVFRSIKFDSAHSVANIIIFNYLNRRNAITVETHEGEGEEEGEEYNVFANFSIMETAIHTLLKEILNLQAGGSKAEVSHFLTEYGQVSGDLKLMTKQLANSEHSSEHKTPVDIRIVYGNTFAEKK